jgi:hypothetical protein
VPEQQQQVDVERLVAELELGVDRLRSLYEQYFMGIEKLEPLVPRKDVDRRIHVLRKEQIRNTALRFRFQMIVQRYNTYQTHWQRICREIENGTYKRHVVRANKRFAPAEQEPRSSPPPRRSSVPPRPEAGAGAEAGARPPSVTAPAKPLPLRAPPLAPAGFPQPGAAVSAELAAELAELEAEFGPLDGAPPRSQTSAGVRTPERKALVQPLAPAPMAAPTRPTAANPGVPHPFAPKTTAPRAAPLQAPAARSGEAARPPAQAAPPAPAPAVRTQPAPAPPPKPAGLGGQAAAPPAARAPAPAPTPPARPLAPAAPAAAARPLAATASDLPEQRVRALYQQYVDAKRRQNESTAALTYESVARSIRDSGAKLREKYGKSVDFEVAVRDGKTILKPVIK